MAARSKPDALLTPQALASLSVQERLLLFCLASGTDWDRAGITHATAQQLRVCGLIDRNQSARRFKLTLLGRAVLDALLRQQIATRSASKLPLNGPNYLRYQTKVKLGHSALSGECPSYLDSGQNLVPPIHAKGSGPRSRSPPVPVPTGIGTSFPANRRTAPARRYFVDSGPRGAKILAMRSEDSPPTATLRPWRASIIRKRLGRV
jgi:hypothetical protein